jgi:outer membrane protein assembly factor BamB
VRSLRPETGQEIWKQTYDAPYTINPAAVKHGKGVKSTPLVYGGRVYTLGIGGILSCFDAASGRLQWRHDFKDQFRSTSPEFGVAMSPAAEEGAVIAHVGGQDGSLAAFDAVTGKVKWSWTGDGPAYSSPVAAVFEGVRQIVTHSRQHVVGVQASTGELLWKIPFTTPYTQNSVTPLAADGKLVISGLNNGAFALRVGKRGTQWTTEKLWHSDEASMYMSSPVAAGGRLFAFSNKNKGQLVCLDAANGKTIWTSPPRLGDNAALVRTGKWLLMLTDNAELSVIPLAAAGFEIARKYTVAESATWAHPVPAEKGLLIKDVDSLALWTWE